MSALDCEATKVKAQRCEAGDSLAAKPYLAFWGCLSGFGEVLCRLSRLGLPYRFSLLQNYKTTSAKNLADYQRFSL